MPQAGRVRERYLGQRVVAIHRSHQRVGADDARRAARTAVPAGEHAAATISTAARVQEQNLFAESIVCLDAATGVRKWHYQIVHHGLWDYDLPSPPSLVSITARRASRVDAVVQLTKQGLAFVFDRVTGKPVWPIEERPVPASDMPGEQAWPTQPFPTQPSAARGARRVAKRTRSTSTPDLHAAAVAEMKKLRLGPDLHAAVGARHAAASRASSAAPTGAAARSIRSAAACSSRRRTRRTWRGWASPSRAPAKSKRTTRGRETRRRSSTTACRS